MLKYTLTHHISLILMSIVEVARGFARLVLILIEFVCWKLVAGILYSWLKGGDGYGNEVMIPPADLVGTMVFFSVLICASYFL